MLHVDESVQMESRPGRFYHFISTCVLIVDRRRCSACFQLYQRLLASLDPLLIDRWGGGVAVWAGWGEDGGRCAAIRTSVKVEWSRRDRSILVLYGTSGSMELICKLRATQFHRSARPARASNAATIADKHKHGAAGRRRIFLSGFLSGFLAFFLFFFRWSQCRSSFSVSIAQIQSNAHRV